MNRKEQLHQLLKEKRSEKKLHDFYLENPGVKFAWVKKKYTKEDYAAFSLSTFFMLMVFALLVYFFYIGFFNPNMIREREVSVTLLDSYLRGERMNKKYINKSAK